jgi:hypothetical protein
MALTARPGAAVAITVDTKAGFDRVAATFGRMPKASARAMARALRKLATWLKRQALRAASQAAEIPQKFFQRALRYHVEIEQSGGMPVGLSVWIGTNPVKAHRLGSVRWTKRMKGARVGSRSYPGSWSWGRGKTGPAVMFRHGSARLPLGVEKEWPHEPVLRRLRGLQDEAGARFERLLRQELNYALNHEVAR